MFIFIHSIYLLCVSWFTKKSHFECFYWKKKSEREKTFFTHHENNFIFLRFPFFHYVLHNTHEDLAERYFLPKRCVLMWKMCSFLIKFIVMLSLFYVIFASLLMHTIKYSYRYMEVSYMINLTPWTIWFYGLRHAFHHMKHSCCYWEMSLIWEGYRIAINPVSNCNNKKE